MEDLAAVMADSAAAMLIRRPRVVSLADMPMAAATRSTAEATLALPDADTTAAVDIMAPVLDSASGFMRPTDMPLRFAIPPDSMTRMVSGKSTRAALSLTDIKFDGRHRSAISCAFLGSFLSRGSPNRLN